MPLSFDDLIPQQQRAPQAVPPPQGGLSFDDLVPQKEAAPAATPAERPSIWQMALNDVARIPSNIYGGLKDIFTLPHDVYSGEAVVPQSANMPGGETVAPGMAASPVMGRAVNFALGTMPVAEAGGLTKPAPFKSPTESALEASKTARYQSPEVTGLQLGPEAGQDVANIMRTDLKAAKFDKYNGKQFYDIADILEKGPRFGDNYTLSDFEAARQGADVEATAPKNIKRGAQVVRDAIDNYLGNIPQNHVVSGDAAAANNALLKARDDFSALKRSEEVTNALGRAQNRESNANSGMGRLDNLTRQQLTPILDKKTGVAKTKGFEDYTPQELDALRNAIDPGWLQNQARVIKNKLGGGGGAAHTMANVLGFLGASHFGASPEMAAGVGYGLGKVGQGFGALADKLAYSRVNDLGELLRSRSALADEMRAAGQGRQNLSPLWLRAPLIGLGAPSVPTLGINAQGL